MTNVHISPLKLKDSLRALFNRLDNVTPKPYLHPTSREKNRAMSGLELAGVVLGAIPLIVAALENYGNGLSTLQRWRRYERELRSLIRNLKTEHVKLQNVCEKLLLGLVRPSRIEAMINDPMGDMWKEDETHDKVRARLHKCFNVFEATVRDVQEAVEEMDRRINAQKGGAVSEFKKAVFTLRRSQYEDLLSKIREGVSNLENLTDRNIDLEPARIVRSYGKTLVMLQDMSRSLYRALKSSLGCICEHQIGLWLESRKLRFIPGDDEGGCMKGTEFKLALSYGSDAGNEPGQVPERRREWEEIRVKPSQGAKTRRLPAENPVPPQQPKKGKGKKSVSFAGPMISSTSTTTLTQTETQPSATSIHMPIASLTMEMASLGMVSMGVTLDLCQKIKKAQKQAQLDYYGMIVDRSPPNPREYTVHPAPTLEHDDMHQWSVISLREILEQKSAFPHLSYRDRLQLAVVISSSVLQLQGSPWLPDALTSCDICFVRKQGRLAYNHPFIINRLPSTELGPRNDETAMLPIGNPMLTSLGILLIELILGKTLASLRTLEEASLAEETPLADYVTAQRVSRRIKMVSLNYGTAVSRCISGDWNRDGSLDMEDLCQDVYSGVVALLEKDLENS